MDNGEGRPEMVTLASWLREFVHPTVQEPRPSILDEVDAPNQEIRDHLTTKSIEHRLSFRVAQDVTDALGWSNVRRRFVPASSSVARGDFGEMIATAILNDVFSLLEELIGTELEMVHEEPARGDLDRTGGDTSLIESDLGWKARWPLHDGLQAQIDWLARSGPERA